MTLVSGKTFAAAISQRNTLVFIPEKKMVVAITSNDGDRKKAEAAAWEIVKAHFPAELSHHAPPQQAGDKTSPFTAVRWRESQPEVRLGEEWFKLVSLDEIPAAEIVAFSRRTYGVLWRKRFEEDLVELLTGMKHPPQDKVTLVVQSLTSSETWVRERVPMTSANRAAIRDAARTRTIPEP